MARLDWLLALLVLTGFVVAWFGQNKPVLVQISELSDQDVGKNVLLVGQVRWQNGTRLQLCQAKACVRAVVFGQLGSNLAGRRVALQGKWQKSVLLVSSGKAVDVLG